MIPTQCLDPALDSRAGGVPLVETVEHGAIVLRRAGPGRRRWTSAAGRASAWLQGAEAVASAKAIVYAECRRTDRSSNLSRDTL